MRFITLCFTLLTLATSSLSHAMTDDESMVFTEAVRTGDVKVVKKFLDAGTNVNEKFFAWESLQMAANKNQLEVIKLLIDRGADLNYQHPLTKMSALHFAAYNGNKEIVNYLIAKGANKNLKLRGGVSIVRALRDEGKNEMADYLLSVGVLDDGCQEEKCL